MSQTLVQPQPSVSSISEPSTIVERLFQSVQNCDYESALNLFAADFTFQDLALDLTIRDRAKLGDYYREIRAEYASYALSYGRVYHVEAELFCEWVMKATRPQLSLGRQIWFLPISLPGISVAKVAGGKIVQWTEYYDSGSAWRARVRDLLSDWPEI